jgi:Methyltransferase domain
LTAEDSFLTLEDSAMKECVMDIPEKPTTKHRTTRRLKPMVLVAAVAGVCIGLRARRGTDGLRWYQRVYRLIYQVGLIIWRRATPPAELVELVEGPSALAVGRALDLGCGTGTDTIYLARHGWDVTAVDMVPKALAIARRNAPPPPALPRASFSAT